MVASKPGVGGQAVISHSESTRRRAVGSTQKEAPAAVGPALMLTRAPSTRLAGVSVGALDETHERRLLVDACLQSGWMQKSQFGSPIPPALLTRRVFAVTGLDAR